MLDIGGRSQFARQEGLKSLQIPRDDLKDEVDFAVQHVAFAYRLQCRDMRLERLEVRLRLTFQADHGEDHDAILQRRRIQVGMIALNDPGLFKRPHAAQAGRRGQPDTLCQLDIGQPSLRLQIGEDLPVDIIQPRRSISDDFVSTALRYCHIIPVD